jgi:hypothetical protein
MLIGVCLSHKYQPRKVMSSKPHTLKLTQAVCMPCIVVVVVIMCVYSSSTAVHAAATNQLLSVHPTSAVRSVYA